MSAVASPKTHCPVCNAKLHRQDLSLCAYCGSPLSIGDSAGSVDDETVQRLKRLRDHAGFPAALAFSPRDMTVERRAARLLTLGLCVAPPAVLLYVWTNHFTFVHPPHVAWSWLSYTLLALAAVLMIVPAILRSSDRKKPMLRRPALVVVRRSSTDDKGTGTTYHFTLRFDDGSEGEFHWPGQGTMNEPLVNGFTGVAYTRGADLIDFRRL